MAEGTVHIEYGSAGEFIVQLQSAAGMTNNKVAARAMKMPCRLLDVTFVMTGAGAASDTVQLNRNDGSSAAITDVIDVSAKADKAVFLPGTLDDAEMDFEDGDILELVTASDALVRATARFMEFQATP